MSLKSIKSLIFSSEGEQERLGGNMFCSKCGKESVDTAIFCIACGNRLSFQKSMAQETITEVPKSGWQLERMSVVLLLFLTTITSGIYYASWFLKRRNAINNLQSNEKIRSGVFVFAIVAIGIGLLAELIAGCMEALGRKIMADGCHGLAIILSLISGITLWVQCFKVRRIFNDHFNSHLKKGMFLSRLTTFFFSIYYLQYKINRLWLEKNNGVRRHFNNQEEYNAWKSERMKIEKEKNEFKAEDDSQYPANGSPKRFKPISATPNLLFIIYLLVAFPLYHLLYLNNFNPDYFMIGQIYGNIRTFTVFFAEFFGFSIPPLIFIIIYNSKITEGKIKTVSIIVTTLFILLATVGTFSKISSKGSYSKSNTDENKEKETVSPPVGEEKRLEGQDNAASSSATTSTPIFDSFLAEEWLEKGNASSTAGKKYEAIVAYTKAIEMKPNYAEAFYNRGLVYKNLGDYVQAIRDYNKAIELNPKFVEAYHERGTSYHALGS
jgi:tetratricopeptide (TPR) repeat protein